MPDDSVFVCKYPARAGNFRMVDIDMNAWSSLFLNLKTNLILYFYPWKVYKIQPIRVAHQKPVNLKFCTQFKINIQKREGLSNFENRFLIFLYYIQKTSGLSKKLKVSTLDIRIKQSGLKVYHSKVPSSGAINYIGKGSMNVSRCINY